MSALDENESEDIELEVKIHFKEPQGNEVDWEFWVDALDSFLEYDNLNDFVQDTDYWHSQTDFLLTGSAFRFNLDRVDLRAPNVILDGEAIRYVDQKIMGGNLITLTDEDQHRIPGQVRDVVLRQGPRPTRPSLRDRQCDTRPSTVLEGGTS